ncbi:5899_t:CDS:2 [Cetraspora pellucida]|uniref:5899_t:CDS:1 n=1 Tax=Cetraspora pellucida TaxID=1433469 RepID=A0ACA9JWR3_9GLOM|nr:5899_t:CDS:2 [Cetraspora pellucida]
MMIADFGISKHAKNNQIITTKAVGGVPSYMDPKYLSDHGYMRKFDIENSNGSNKEPIQNPKSQNLSNGSNKGSNQTIHLKPPNVLNLSNISYGSNSDSILNIQLTDEPLQLYVTPPLSSKGSMSDIQEESEIYLINQEHFKLISKWIFQGSKRTSWEKLFGNPYLNIDVYILFKS